MYIHGVYIYIPGVEYENTPRNLPSVPLSRTADNFVFTFTLTFSFTFSFCVIIKYSAGSFPECHRNFAESVHNILE